MRKFAYLLSWVAGLAAIVAVSLSGCGGAECADGTVEQDGECVLSEDFDCPDGEVYHEGDEECVTERDCGPNTSLDGDVCVADEPAECGEGTELDAQTNQCHTTDLVCEGNTAFSAQEDRCVPTDEVCQDGTEYDEETHLCYPAGECQPGDVIIDGFCASEIEARAADADYVADSNTNPEFGGEPVDIDIDVVEQEFDFTGTIDGPSDLDGDGMENQHLDVFRFEAEAGEWFEITIRSIGLPDPAFVVTSEDGLGYYERFTADGTGNYKSRQIAVPEDGNYLVTVFPGAIHYGDQFGIGGDQWDYLGSIRQLDDVQPEFHDFSQDNLTGSLGDGTDNFVHYDDMEQQDGQFFLASWLQAPESTEFLVQAWASPTDYLGEFEGESPRIPIPDSEELFLVIDWKTSYGFHDMEYELSAATGLTLLPNTEQQVVVDAEDFDALVAGFDSESTSSLDVSIIDDDGFVVEEGAITRNDSLDVMNLDEGAYTVIYDNTGSEDFQFFETDVEVVPPGGDTTFEASEEDLIEISQDNDSGEPLDILLVHEDSGELLIDEAIDAESSSSFDEPLVYEVDEQDGNLTFYYYDLHDMEGLNVDATLGALTDLANFNAADDDFVVISQSNNFGMSVDFWVTHDDSGDVILEPSLNDGAELRYEIDEYTGDFTAKRYDWGDVPGLDFQADIVSPEALTTFHGQDDDIISLTQTNDDEAPVEFWMIHDDTGDVVLEETLEDEEELRYEIDEYTGDFTLEWYDFGDAGNLDFQAEVVSPSELTSFETEVNDILAFLQENDQDEDIDFWLVHDDTGDVVMEDSVSIDEILRFETDEYVGGFTVYWYDFGEITGLDFHAQGVTPEVTKTVTADALDALLVTQTNGADETIDVLVQHEASGTVVGDGELEHDGELNVNTGEYSGEFTLQYYDFGLAPNVQMDADIYSPTLIDTFSADANDGIVLSQSNDDDISLDVIIENASTGELVYRQLGMPADEDQIFNIGQEGGNFQVYWYDFSETTNVSISSQVVPPESIETFHADTDDLVLISQDNDDSGDVDLFVEHDATGEIAFEDTLSTDDEGRFVVGDNDGDFTVKWYDFDNAENLDVTVEVGALTQADTFTGSGGDVISVTQSNDDGNDLEMFIEDDSGTMVAERSLSTSDEVEIIVPPGGSSYTVYWYDFGNSDNVEFVADPLASEHMVNLDAIFGDVFVITQDNPDSDDVSLLVVDEDGLVVAQESDLGTDDGDVLRVLGVYAGEYDVYAYTDDDDIDLGDVDVTADVKSPEVITDFSAAYSGTANNNESGPHEYYIFDVDEPVTYDMEIERLGSSGSVEIFLYQMVNEFIDDSTAGTGFSPGNLEYDFEPDETYLLRIGRDFSFSSTDTDYEFTFTEQ